MQRENCTHISYKTDKHMFFFSFLMVVDLTGSGSNRQENRIQTSKNNSDQDPVTTIKNHPSIFF